MSALQGQRVVVVGGTSGMGWAAACAAADAGAEVIAAGHHPDPSRTHRSVRTIALDITDEQAVASCFAEIGALDHLLVTASPRDVGVGSFLEQELASARKFMDGKFFGAWLCARHAAPRMHAGSSITFLTGCASIRPKPGITMITATFAALESLSQALALELGPIRVNTIRPGLIDSSMWDGLTPEARDDLRRRTAATFPARRIGTVEDIAHAAVFLMTNPYVTGTTLEVSGGEPLVST